MNLPEPRRYTPFKSGAFRMAMGLNELNLNEWIELDKNYHAEMAQKLRLLTETLYEVFTTRQVNEVSSRDMLALLAAHLASRFAEFFQIFPTQFSSALTGEKLNLSEPAHHPLDAAARLVQEDL